MNNGNSISSGCNRTKKNANYGVQLLPKRPFRLICFVLVSFRNSWCSQVQWCPVMFSREIPFCYFINHETVSFLIICFCSSVTYFFYFFSPFFALLPPFLFFHKLWLCFSFLFICFCSLFSFFLVFRTRHGVVGKDLVRDEALRSVALNQNKMFLDDQLRFLGNCLPTPPLTNR